MKAEEILRALPVHYYVIDLKNKRIVESNDPKVKAAEKPCFMQLFNVNEPCLNMNGECKCEQKLKKDFTGNFILEGFEQGAKKFLMHR